MPPEFIQSIPAFQPELSQKAIARVVEMRGGEKASYMAIAKEFQITRAKAKHTYGKFYHEQVLTMIKAKQEQLKSSGEKQALWRHYFNCYRTPKQRYDALMEEQGRKI